MLIVRYDLTWLSPDRATPLYQTALQSDARGRVVVYILMGRRINFPVEVLARGLVS